MGWVRGVVVWDGMIRLVVVTALLAITTSGLSADVNKLMVSAADGPVAPKPPSLVRKHVVLASPASVAFLFPVLTELPARHLFLGPPVRVT